MQFNPSMLGPTLVLLSTLASTLAASAQDKPAATAERVQEIVGSQFATTKCPGLSVAVAAEGEIVASLAFGMADVEQGVGLRTSSVHRLASISKPITATIAMDLVEQGKIELGASVRSYLPELPESYQGVTIRHLLSHQSGVRGYENPVDVALNVQHFATSRDSVKTFMSHPLVFEPGTKTEYSSLSFAVVGAVAEAVTARSFRQVAGDFFDKYRISGFMIDDPLAIVPGRVRGYLVDPTRAMTFNDGQRVSRDYLTGTRDAITNARAHDVSNRYPAAGFTASASDLLRFVIALRSGKILKPETVQDGTRVFLGLDGASLRRRGEPWWA